MFWFVVLESFNYMQSDCQLILNVADMLQSSYDSILIEEKEYFVFMGTMTISKFMNLNIIYMFPIIVAMLVKDHPMLIPMYSLFHSV